MADNRSIAPLNTGGGGSGRALFPKGPSFTLEKFSNKDFIVRDFVDDLADSAVPVNRRSGPAHQAFDPKPLIRTFESMRIVLFSASTLLTCRRCIITAG